MCNLYNFTSPAQAVRHFFDLLGPISWNFEPLPEIHPTDRAPIVRLNAQGERELVALRWWLVPRWAKEISRKYAMFNAVGETLSERAAFREPFKTQRCLVPANGFYEWPVIEGKKVKHWLGMKDGGLFAMAGLWERAEQLPEGPLESFTIITTVANDLVTRYHPKRRMPAILDRSAFAAWLDPKTPMGEVRDLIETYPDEAMAAKKAA
jgi:putative SOS response-associated peptidase YedK